MKNKNILKSIKVLKTLKFIRLGKHISSFYYLHKCIITFKNMVEEKVTQEFRLKNI